ncbi:MAG: hypothetical protein ABSE63_17640 [Thermoguttaceae bacterium]|jgi:Leucine-rich repeat (LRR) protein
MSTDQSQQAQPPAGKTGRRRSKVSIIIWIVVLIVIGAVLYVSFTPSGQVMMGNIVDQGFGNWLFGEGNVKDENEAAAELEKCGVMVIKEQNKGVTLVDFSNCLKPTDEALKQITKLRHLSTANFLNAEINDDQLAYLNNMNHLSNLLINGTPITDAGLEHLESLPALQTLHACYIKITDKGMEYIAKVPTLTILNLSGNDITDKGIKQIAQLPKLNWLLIQGTKVTDAGLSELSSLPQLGRLSLSKDMKVSQEGIQKLKKAIPKLQVDLNKAESPPEKPKAVPPPEKPATDTPPAAE